VMAGVGLVAVAIARSQTRPAELVVSSP
jgi:hypothetical protein